MTASFRQRVGIPRGLHPPARVGSPSRRGQGRGGGCHAGLSLGRETRRLRCGLPLPPQARSSPRAPGAPRTPAASPERCTAQTTVLGARGRGPGVQRGPRRGPAVGPGRMRPGAARELSRVPAPAPSGPGHRSRSRRPAPGRHDFQAAFRLDSLQVRGPGFPGSRACSDPHSNAEGGEEDGSAQPGHPPSSESGCSVGRGHLAWRQGTAPSVSFPTPGARVGGAGLFHPNFEGLKATCPFPPSSTPKAS